MPNSPVSADCPKSTGAFCPAAVRPKVARELLKLRRAMHHALMGETIDGNTAAEWSLVYEALPLQELTTRVEQVAKMLLAKNPVALKATKDAIRRVGEMTYDSTRRIIWCALNRRPTRSTARVVRNATVH